MTADVTSEEGGSDVAVPLPSEVSPPTKVVLPTPDIQVIRRKLNGYVGFANLPKQWHRKLIRRGFNLNLMVVGESGLGKLTLLNTLFNRELYPPTEPYDVGAPKKEEVTILTVQADIEENGVTLHLTVIDAPGFGAGINNTDLWTPIVSEINLRFDQYLEAESKALRMDIVDGRVHALLYFIEPTGHLLKALDIALMKQVHTKVNLIPVVAKLDTMTEEEIAEFKQRVNDDLSTQNITVFRPPEYENDDDETIHATQEIMSRVPFAVVGLTQSVTTPDGRHVRGRAYPWGVIEVDNENHCDFVKLRQLLVRNFLEELQDHTSKHLYENYRSEKLTRMGIEQDDLAFREFDPSLRQEEEKALHEAKLAKMETEMKAVFQAKVSEKEKKLQMLEAELFSRHKEMKEKLLKQVKVLEEKKAALERAAKSPEVALQPKGRKGFLR